MIRPIRIKRIKKRVVITQEEIDSAKKEYFARGGKITKLKSSEPNDGGSRPYQIAHRYERF